MRIMIVTDAWLPQINGVSRTFQELASDLPTLGHEIDVVHPGDFRFALRAPGYKDMRLVFPLTGQLGNRIRSFKPDAVHIATEGPLGWGMRFLCGRHGYNFTTSYCTHWDELSKASLPGPAKRMGSTLVGHGIRFFHGRAAKLFVATDKLGQEAAARGITPPKHVIGRGVDTALFKPGEKTEFLNLPRPVSLYVGRIAPEKNIDEFLEMDVPGSKVLVGDGPSLAAYKSRYASDRVVFTGPKVGTELAAHFRSADIFVFTSNGFDTFGRVMLEAMASGLPIVAYPLAAAPMLVTEETYGALGSGLRGPFMRVAGLLSAYAADVLEKRHERARQYGTKSVAEKFVEGQVPLRP